MKRKDLDRMEFLLARFFDGNTSNREEQELYALMARIDLPDEMKRYRPLMSYFETGIARELGETAQPQKKFYQTRRFRQTVAVFLAVAASLLCLLVPDWGGKGESDTDDFNPYAGSYIIHNGVKTEIPESVARELEAEIIRLERKQMEKERMALQKEAHYRKKLERRSAFDSERRDISRPASEESEFIN